MLLLTFRLIRLSNAAIHCMFSSVTPPVVHMRKIILSPKKPRHERWTRTMPTITPGAAVEESKVESIIDISQQAH